MVSMKVCPTLVPGTLSRVHECHTLSPVQSLCSHERVMKGVLHGSQTGLQREDGSAIMRADIASGKAWGALRCAVLETGLSCESKSVAALAAYYYSIVLSAFLGSAEDVQRFPPPMK